MARPTMEVTTLHGYTIEELISIKNNAESKYTRLALTSVTMRYCGYSNAQIVEATGLNRVTILLHIKGWNKQGMASTKDCRGGNRPTKLSPDIVDDLIYVALNKKPVDFEFMGHTWTLNLLSQYVYQNYEIEVSYVTIRSILIANNLSFKRAQPSPTKADKMEQEAFKKKLRGSEYFRIFT